MKRVVVRLCAAVVAVGAVAGCGDEEPPPSPPEADVVVTGTAALQFDPTDLTLDRGATMALQCEQGPAHDMVVSVDGEEVEVVACAGGQSSVTTVDLPAGEYTFWCTITGHRAAGMEGTLTVK